VFIHDRPFLLTVMSLSKPIVMKFGGTSVEDAHAFERVAHIVSRDQDSLPVVVVSVSEEPKAIRAALHAGAAGYIPKTLSAHDMLAAMKIIADGDVYVPPQAG